MKEQKYLSDRQWFPQRGDLRWLILFSKTWFPNLKQSDVIIVRDAGIVLRVWGDALNLHLLTIVSMRATSCDAELYRPPIHVRVTGTVQAVRMWSIHYIVVLQTRPRSNQYFVYRFDNLRTQLNFLRFSISLLLEHYNKALTHEYLRRYINFKWINNVYVYNNPKCGTFTSCILRTLTSQRNVRPLTPTGQR